MNYSPERALWATVLQCAVKDLCAADNSNDRREALAWLGTKRPTRDFEFVASAAGIDPEAAWTRLRALAVRPDRLAHVRRAFGAADATQANKRTLHHAA